MSLIDVRVRSNNLERESSTVLLMRKRSSRFFFFFCALASLWQHFNGEPLINSFFFVAHRCSLKSQSLARCCWFFCFFFCFAWMWVMYPVNFTTKIDPTAYSKYEYTYGLRKFLFLVEKFLWYYIYGTVWKKIGENTTWKKKKSSNESQMKI